MLGSLILYLKGMRRMMFQLSGFYYRDPHTQQEHSPYFLWHFTIYIYIDIYIYIPTCLATSFTKPRGLRF